MKNLKKLVPGTVITVKRVGGGYAARKELERSGILAGADLTILCVMDDSVTVDAGKGPRQLTPEEEAAITYQEQFRRNGDPVLLGGCCAYGNTGDIIDRMQESNDVIFGQQAGQ